MLILSAKNHVYLSGLKFAEQIVQSFEHSFINYRKESSFNLGTAEQKLLYSLHWILSDAADECSLQAEEEGKLDISTFAYLFPLSAITVTLNITINLKVVL